MDLNRISIHTNIHTLKYVKAGEACKVIPLVSDVSEKSLVEIWQKHKEYLDESDSAKSIFMVIGESMAPEGVHTNDLLLVSHCEKEALCEGQLIVLKIDEERQRKRMAWWSGKEQLGYKMRKYIATLDLNENDEAIKNLVKSKDEYLKLLPEYEGFFDEKLKQATKEIAKDAWNNVLLSITYSVKGREYSFHPEKDLYGKVDYLYFRDVNSRYVEKSMKDGK